MFEKINITYKMLVSLTIQRLNKLLTFSIFQCRNTEYFYILLITPFPVQTCTDKIKYVRSVENVKHYAYAIRMIR